MYVLPLALVITISLAITLSRNGIGSFVTLGVIGAALYAIPPLVDVEQSLGGITRSAVRFTSVPQDVQLVVFCAWLALLASLILCSTVFAQPGNTVALKAEDERMRSVGTACVLLGIFGVLYLSFAQESLFFFLEERADQDSGVIATLWRWAPLLGLISGSLARDRRTLIVSGLLLLLVFLRGDRTLVAIATAAAVVTASYKNPGWWRRLRPSQIAAFIFAAAAVFLGKSIYIVIKAIVTGGSTARIDIPLKEQFLYQFEPLGTFAHLQFVMRNGIVIPFGQFVESVVGNLLLIPSAFGVSTNLYNTIVTSHLSSRLSSGVAGNYLAHGYTVGGLPMAAFFYFMIPLMLRFCDAQFRKKTGTVKIFWCCVGAVIAFYIQRNGLDNLFSFVRQILIVCIATAGLAAMLRHLGVYPSAVPRGVLVAGGAVPIHEFNRPTPPSLHRPRRPAGG